MLLTLHAGDKLWWADQASERMGTCNKKDGTEVTVLRNSTTLVMHMKVYDESIQQGERPAGDVWNVGGGPGGAPTLRHPSPFASPCSRQQPLQREQRRLLAAVPAHLGDLTFLHVHRWVQPEERAAVL